jgi:hypothetical protein
MVARRIYMAERKVIPLFDQTRKIVEEANLHPVVQKYDMIWMVVHAKTGAHIDRTADGVVDIGIMDGYSDQELYELALADKLHDTGKLFIPRNLLFKRGKYTPGEKVMMSMHTRLGYNQLIKEGIPNRIAAAALLHHSHQPGGLYRVRRLEAVGQEQLVPIFQIGVERRKEPLDPMGVRYAAFVEVQDKYDAMTTRSDTGRFPVTNTKSVAERLKKEFLGDRRLITLSVDRHDQLVTRDRPHDIALLEKAFW